MKKMTRSESARKAAITRWARVTRPERKRLLSLIAKLGAKARWKGHTKVVHTSLRTALAK